MQNPVFAAAGLEWVESVAQRTAIRVFLSGEVLLREDDAIDHVWVVLSGAVRLYLGRSNQREITTRICRAPMLIGDVELLAGATSRYNVEVIEQVELGLVAADDYQHMLAHSPDAMKQQLMHLANLVALDGRSQHQLLASVDERLAHLLLVYADLFGVQMPSGETVIPDPPSLQQLASSLGYVRRSVVNALRRLRDAGLVRREGYRLVLSSIGDLERQAGFLREGLSYTMSELVRPASDRPTETDHGGTLAIADGRHTTPPGERPLQHGRRPL